MFIMFHLTAGFLERLLNRLLVCITFRNIKNILAYSTCQSFKSLRNPHTNTNILYVCKFPYQSTLPFRTWGIQACLLSFSSLKEKSPDCRELRWRVAASTCKQPRLWFEHISSSTVLIYSAVKRVCTRRRGERERQSARSVRVHKYASCVIMTRTLLNLFTLLADVVSQLQIEIQFLNVYLDINIKIYIYIWTNHDTFFYILQSLPNCSIYVI